MFLRECVDRDRESANLPSARMLIGSDGRVHDLPIVCDGVEHRTLDLDGLHDDVLKEIVSFLEAESVCSVACTCRRLRKLCEYDGVWRNLVHKKFGVRQNRTIVSSTKPSPTNCESWDDRERRFVIVERLSWKLVYEKHREVLFALFRWTSLGKVRPVAAVQTTMLALPTTL